MIIIMQLCGWISSYSTQYRSNYCLVIKKMTILSNNKHRKKKKKKTRVLFFSNDSQNKLSLKSNDKILSFSCIYYTTIYKSLVVTLFSFSFFLFSQKINKEKN
jgi:hypothetical protein